jgi:hypothetical protein
VPCTWVTFGKDWRFRNDIKSIEGIQ